jgi:signal transduction histidine kinase
MKLTTRFFLSHGGVVVITLLVSFVLVYEGSRILYLRQARLTQVQGISDFALAAKESLIQHEDVAVLNFMKSAVKNPTVAYAAYSNPSAGKPVVLPPEFQREVFPPGYGKTGASGSPARRLLANGLEVLEWTDSVQAINGMRGQVWLGFSQVAMDKDLREQTAKWMRLELEAGAAALLVGLVVSITLGLQMAAPLRKIRDGTHLVRSGQLGSLVGVSRNDEIGDLARDFNAMVTQLKELDEMKRDFMAGVTHDLGTPLHAIRSAINYLQAGDAGPLTEKQSEYLLMVSNSTAHLTAFINNLLTTARIEAAKVDPYPEPVDVFAHVKELVTLYQPQAAENGVQLTLVKKNQYISLVADVTMFRQIVLNLLSNALKFTPGGEVDVLLSEEDGDFVLEVRDTGIGIDPIHHQLIFDKFYRVHQPVGSPARQGSGLGLTIVKGLTEAHGGKVVVESVLGKGSAFKVILPKQPRRL